MAEHSRSSHSQDLFHILGFGSICKACKYFISQCYPDKKNNNKSLFPTKTGHKTKRKPIEDDTKITRNQTFTKRNPDKENNIQQIHNERKGSKNANLGGGGGGGGPSPLSRSASSRSLRNPTPPDGGASLLRSMSHINSLDSKSVAALRRSLSRSASRTRGGSTPIVYSNSHGLMKPPPMELQLHCSLEELCFGCIKKINVVRDVVTRDGRIVEEDEVLTIKVKPGWRKGTKITFEGKGNEVPGADPADLVFTVAEEEHHLFKRQEDDLVLRVDIPLIEALTGCSLSVPLLDKQTTSLRIDDVVHPGYEKIVVGQGMPKQKEAGRRGNLIIKFLVKFPEHLTEEQRFDAANILQQCS